MIDLIFVAMVSGFVGFVIGAFAMRYTMLLEKIREFEETEK